MLKVPGRATKGGDEIVDSRAEGGIGVRMSVSLRVASTSFGVGVGVMIGGRKCVEQYRLLLV